MEDLTNAELRHPVGQLRDEVAALRERVSELEAENATLRDENARLKGDKGRPKLKPYGMDKATSGAKAKAGRKKPKHALCHSPVVGEERKLSAAHVHQGVRLGRTTHVVDMADEDSRAAYTALSNTIIGVVLLAGGIFGDDRRSRRLCRRARPLCADVPRRDRCGCQPGRGSGWLSGF